MTAISFDRKANRLVIDMLSKMSHHMSLGVIVTSQIAFPSQFKGISQNCKFQMFWSMRRDPTYSLWVGRQFRPDYPRIIYEALEKSIKQNPYAYIVLDLSPETPEFLRVRNALVPDPSNHNFQIYVVPYATPK